ncbi:MAG: hypothetical protein EOP48_16665 [Sphingobacteriales bacterium]|nr:MAG: hypothetical protein EOP48_16665 [Sphingobacteriales bacterium]
MSETSDYSSEDYDQEEYQTQLKIYENQIADYKEEVKAFKEEIKEYKNYLDKVIDKASDLFEKQLIYVAAGTIAGSVFIVESRLTKEDPSNPEYEATHEMLDLKQVKDLRVFLLLCSSSSCHIQDYI